MDHLMSWGRYPAKPQRATAVSWQQDIAAQMQRHQPGLVYGNGRSYGDSCLAANQHVLQLQGMDKFLAADWTSGQIRVEAGVTLQQIYQQALPRGWFLPVTPGTQFVTVGGALANDVHGKNHHVRGTFGCHARAFLLWRSDSGFIECSPGQHAELFAATIGGLGLTGVICWVDLQLMPVLTSQIDTHIIRFDNLQQFCELSDRYDHLHEYGAAWVDCQATGPQLGRGVYFFGDHARFGTTALPTRTKLTVPLTPPWSMMNSMTLQLFNQSYYHLQPAQAKTQRSCFEPFFYPLDGILHWNRVYGRAGFQQYQCVMPGAAAEQAIRELLLAISASGQGSFLAVLKRCGDITSPGLISFPMPGISLALDFAQSAALPALFARLDAIVRAYQGRLYPAKDAHMTAEDFRLFYPRWLDVEQLRDPTLMSMFWERVSR